MSYSDIIIAVIGPSLAFLGVLSTLLYNKKNQLERQLDDAKRKVFEDFMEALMHTMENGNQTTPEDQDQLEKAMRKLKTDLIVYGSPRTIRAHNRWLLDAHKKNADAINFRNVERLIRAFRKEIGLSNRFYLRKYEVIQVMVRDDIYKSIKDL